MTNSEDIAELGRTVRQFLAQHSDESAVRALMEDPRGYDLGVWKQMADQLGLMGLTVPEQYGGSGFGMSESFVVFEEMGRSLLPSPFLSTTALAVPALLASGDAEAMQRYLPGIADGTIIATLAISEGKGGWNRDVVTARADHRSDGWRITGEKRYVTDAQNCNLLLVLAQTAEGPALFCVEDDAENLQIAAESPLDQTRRLASVRLDATPAQLVGKAGDGWAISKQALRVGAVALAAEQVGGAQRTLEMGVEYANTRVAFGRKIGSFQAVKHTLANVLVQVENARSAALAAAQAIDDDDPEVDVAVSVAKAYCSDAYMHAAGDNIQVHGGIGFTWEHPAHLYFKRAKSSQILLGSPSYHRELVAQAVGI